MTMTLTSIIARYKHCQPQRTQKHNQESKLRLVLAKPGPQPKSLFTWTSRCPRWSSFCLAAIALAESVLQFGGAAGYNACER